MLCLFAWCSAFLHEHMSSFILQQTHLELLASDFLSCKLWYLLYSFFFSHSREDDDDDEDEDEDDWNIRILGGFWVWFWVDFVLGWFWVEFGMGFPMGFELILSCFVLILSYFWFGLVLLILCLDYQMLKWVLLIMVVDRWGWCCVCSSTMRGMSFKHENWGLFIKCNLVIEGRAQRIVPERTWTFCLWTSKAP